MAEEQEETTGDGVLDAQLANELESWKMKYVELEKKLASVEKEKEKM